MVVRQIFLIMAIYIFARVMDKGKTTAAIVLVVRAVAA